MNGQQVTHSWGEPSKRRVHAVPFAEDWFYSRGGVILERDSKGILVVKSLSGHSVSNGQVVVVRQGDSVEKVASRLTGLGSYRLKRYPEPYKLMAEGIIEIGNQTLRIDFVNNSVKVVYLISQDFVEIRK
jgi:hypothetical protein